MGPTLRLALEWWRSVLCLHIAESIPLAPRLCEVVELFTDARGTPPRVAAVLACGSALSFTDWEPPAEVLATFVARKDAQIMGLEILAVVFGLCAFLQQLRGKLVRIWVDNIGGELALSKGAARSRDHNLLIHSVWHMSVKHAFGVWVERVPSSLNIADEPSREQYDTLRALGARWVEPTLAPELWDPSAWVRSMAA